VIFDWNLGNKIYHGLITLRLCGFPFRKLGSFHQARRQIREEGEREGGRRRHREGREREREGGRGEAGGRWVWGLVLCCRGQILGLCSVYCARPICRNGSSFWVFVVGVSLRGLNNVVSCGYGSQLLLGIVFVLWPMVF
jgi:hypothetical protein